MPVWHVLLPAVGEQVQRPAHGETMFLILIWHCITLIPVLEIWLDNVPLVAKMTPPKTSNSISSNSKHGMYCISSEEGNYHISEQLFQHDVMMITVMRMIVLFHCYGVYSTFSVLNICINIGSLLVYCELYVPFLICKFVIWCHVNSREHSLTLWMY